MTSGSTLAYYWPPKMPYTGRDFGQSLLWALVKGVLASRYDVPMIAQRLDRSVTWVRNNLARLDSTMSGMGEILYAIDCDFHFSLEPRPYHPNGAD